MSRRDGRGRAGSGEDRRRGRGVGGERGEMEVRRRTKKIFRRDIGRTGMVSDTYILINRLI